MPCANCTIPTSPKMAQIGGREGDYAYRCPACSALLQFTMPLVQTDPYGWHWGLWPGQVNPWSEGVKRLLDGDDICACQDLPTFVREHLTRLRKQGLADIEANPERSF